MALQSGRLHLHLSCERDGRSLRFSNWGRYRTLNAACLRSCLAIEGKEKGRNHANSGTGSIRVGSMGQRDRSVPAC